MRLAIRVENNLKSSTRGSLLTLLILFAAAPAIQSECPPIYVFNGEAAGDFFGRSVASAGDVNNDGYADLIVGAPFHSAGKSRNGRAYVFSGLNGDTLYVFTGSEVDDRLGHSVSSAGDVNNDGYDDLIVGAPHISLDNTHSGLAYVFSGKNGDTLYVFSDEATADRLGSSVASAGDVNNDGYSDLIIGAPENDASGPNAGKAYVFSGVNGDTLHVFTGEEAYDLFGKSVASAGDVNNDGYADLFVGAHGNDAGGEFAGRSYVYSGIDGDILNIFTGETANKVIGTSIASGGDVNNDGFADLFIGIWPSGSTGTLSGQAILYSGFNGDTLHIFFGEAAGDGFGHSVASVGDINNDGFGDLMVGAPGKDVDGSDVGRVYVFSGLTGGNLHIFDGEEVGDYFGNNVASAGDVNNDGYCDLIVNAIGQRAGRVYVYSGAPCCCVGVTGNIDCDPTSVVDIADLTTLIDHLFIGLQPLCCKEEGNVNGDAQGEVDIADLTTLIDHLFVSLISTPACQ